MPLKTPTPQRVMLALSGGVDSSASLALLVEEQKLGKIAKLEAAYIKTWMHEADPISDCPWESDIADARAVCEKLGVPFRVVNLVEEYHAHVVKLLVEGYARGITPNPDMACNKFIKFGAFLQMALTEGFTHVATGHYVQKGLRADGRFSLLEGSDDNKDQSYFLAQISYDQLVRAIFPVGGIEKPKVRELAKNFDLPVADKKDSQGICFLGKVKINDFLRRYLPDSEGPIVNHEGREVGKHKGLHHHTLGQRHGFGVPSNRDGEHYVVVAKEFATNTLRIAFDHPTTIGLYQQTMTVHHLAWLHGEGPTYAQLADAVEVTPDTTTIRILARPRYRDPKVPAQLTINRIGETTLVFATPQRALASGQIVAFYVEHELIGSAVFL